MDDSFSSLRIDGGMFSPEFLLRVADANPEIEGCSPADFSTKDEVVSNLRDHLNSVLHFYEEVNHGLPSQRGKLTCTCIS